MTLDCVQKIVWILTSNNTYFWYFLRFVYSSFCSSTFISFSYVVSPGYKMNKCVGAIEEFEFLPLRSGKHLHLTIAVTGWLCSGKYSKYGFCCFTTTTADSFHWLGVESVDKSKPAEINWINYNYIPQFFIRRRRGVLVPGSSCPSARGETKSNKNKIDKHCSPDTFTATLF